MAVPTVVQTAPITQGVAYSTARTVVFGSAVTAGSTIILCGQVYNEGAASLAAATASVAMTGAIFIRLADVPLRYTPKRGMTFWMAEDVDAGATTITVTPAIADALNYCTLTAIEIAGARTESALEVLIPSDTANGVFWHDLGPAPASGSISQADTISVAVTWANDANNRTDIGWQTPTGWTERAKSIVSSGAQRALWLGTKSQTSTDAVSVRVQSTEADLGGRSGVLAILRSPTGSPAPPPPSPGPAPAPSVVAQAFEFQNIDPALAGVVGDVTIQIHAEPTTEPLLGTFIQGATLQEFVADGATSKVVVEHDGVVAVTTGQTVVAVGQNAGNTAGFRGVIEGTVIEL
jgi:hypothetical protein